MINRWLGPLLLTWCNFNLENWFHYKIGFVAESGGNQYWPMFFITYHIDECIVVSVFCLWRVLILTHWGRVTHICVSKLTIIGSDNGLSPGRCQAINWTNAGILLIGPLGASFSESLVGIDTFSFKKMPLKTSSEKWLPFCLGLNVLNNQKFVCIHHSHITSFLNQFFYMIIIVTWRHNNYQFVYPSVLHTNVF